MPPPHEGVKPAGLANDIPTGTQVEVVGVAEDEIDANVLQVAVAHGFHRGVGADGHETRGGHGAMVQRKGAGARSAAGVTVQDGE